MEGKISPTLATFRPYDIFSPRYDVTSKDMMKGCKSVLRQIDWTKVATSMLDTETSTIHPTSYGEILQTQIQESLAETCRKTYYEQRDDESDPDSEESEESDDADAGTESGEDGSGEESYEHSFVDSDGNEDGSVEYEDCDDSSVDAEEVDNNVDDRTDVCAICRNRIAYVTEQLSEVN